MNESRRDFIKGLVLTSFFPSIIATAAAGDKYSLVIPSYKGSRFWIFDWLQHRLTEIEIPIGGLHSAMELSPGRILFFEFWGNSILSYDLNTKEKLKISLPENEFFNGHGALSPDGSKLLTVEQALTSHSLNRTSQIVVRDPKTLQKTGVLYTSASGTFHDLMFLQNRLVVSEGTNYDTMDAKILFFDWHSSIGRVKKSKELSLPGVNGVSNHFLPLSDGRFLSVPAAQEKMEETALAKIVTNEKSYRDRMKELNKIVKYTPTPLFVFERDGSFAKLWSDKDREGLVHNLSSCRIPTATGDFLAVTHMEGHSLTIWKNNQLVKRIAWEENGMPAGIAYSAPANQLLVMDISGRMRFFSAPQFEEIKDRRLQLDGGASHLLKLS